MASATSMSNIAPLFAQADRDMRASSIGAKFANHCFRRDLRHSRANNSHDGWSNFWGAGLLERV